VKDLRVTHDGDLIIDDDLSIVEGGDELCQSLETLLTIEEGEFELEPLIGLDRTHLQGKDYDPAKAEVDITDCIEQHEKRITSVGPIDFFVQERSLSIEMNSMVGMTSSDEEVQFDAEVELDA
jgi:hypothetical protein